MTQNVQSEYNEQEVYIRNGLRVATAACHDESFRRGWWTVDFISDLNIAGNPDTKIAMGHLFATKIALIHSEVSEALEGLRKDKMDEHIPTRKSVEVELADALVRIFDLAGALGLDLGGAIVEKMRYNAMRPDHDLATRNAAGGKKF